MNKNEKNNVRNKKYRLRVIAALCLVFVLCLSLASCTGGSKASDANGSCSDDVKWEYDASDRTLEITGKGAVPAYKNAKEVPWEAAIESIQKIELDDGITSVGSYAFYGCSQLKEADLGTGVAEIGDYAFAYCTILEKLELPETLAKLGEGAFEGCSKLQEIKLGSSLTGLGKRAFAFCPSLKSVHILGTAEILDETFYNCGALETVVFGAGITEDKVSAQAFKNTGFNYSKAQIAADPNTTVTVTVKYVYEDGTKAAEDTVFADLKVGDSYSVNAVEIEGYTADKLTVSGNAPAADSVVTVTYKKNEVVTDEVTEPVTEEPEEEPNKVSSVIFLVVMVLIIAGLGVGGFLLARSNKQNEEKAKNQNKAKNAKNKNNNRK